MHFFEKHRHPSVRRQNRALSLWRMQFIEKHHHPEFQHIQVAPCFGRMQSQPSLQGRNTIVYMIFRRPRQKKNMMREFQAWSVKLRGNLVVTLQGTNISPTKTLLKMTFLLPRWDMLVPWRVNRKRFFHWQTSPWEGQLWTLFDYRQSVAQSLIWFCHFAIPPQKQPCAFVLKQQISRMLWCF